MAKGTATCVCPKCGRTFTREKICGNRADANEWVSWAEDHPGLCPDCWREELEEDRRAASARSAKENAEHGLPSLVGSEKQIAWAEKIRNEYVKASDKLAAQFEESYQRAKARGREDADELKNKLDQVYSTFRQAFFAETSAKAWIDARQYECYGYEVEFNTKWNAEFRKNFKKEN